MVGLCQTNDVSYITLPLEKRGLPTMYLIPVVLVKKYSWEFIDASEIINN
jgi:hypothetical protein